MIFFWTDHGSCLIQLWATLTVHGFSSGFQALIYIIIILIISQITSLTCCTFAVLVRKNPWTALISSWLVGQKNFTHPQGSVIGSKTLTVGPPKADTVAKTVGKVMSIKIKRYILYFLLKTLTSSYNQALHTPAYWMISVEK